jgi:hypothetical protein
MTSKNNHKTGVSFAQESEREEICKLARQDHDESFFLAGIKRNLCINRNNHHKLTFHPLGDFLNPALALLGQGLKKPPIGQKLDFANHPYLCKGLNCC